MHAFTAAKRVVAVVCAVGLLAAAPLALADDDSGYLGVILQGISPSMAKALQLGDRTGVLINDVVDESPAAAAGLEEGDVILSFNGESLDDTGGLSKAVRKAKPGDKVELVVLRDGREQTITAELGEREDDFVWTTQGKDLHFEDFDHDAMRDVYVQRFHGDDGDIRVIVKGLDDDRGYLGIHLDDLSKQMGEYFEVEDGQGALVTEVIEDSPAAAAGLKAGDVIIRMGDQEIASTSGLHEALSDTEAAQEVELKVIRKGKERTVKVTLGEAPEGTFGRNMQFMHQGNDFHFAPKMLHRLPHGNRHVEVLRDMHEDREEIEEMREQLDEMRMQLDEMREELKK